MNNNITHEWIDERIAINTEKAKQMDANGYDNPWRDNVHWRNVERYETYRPLADYDVKVEETLHCHIIVNDRYEFVPHTYNWRVVGRYKWYKSRGLEDFLKRFVKARRKVIKNESIEKIETSGSDNVLHPTESNTNDDQSNSNIEKT